MLCIRDLYVSAEILLPEREQKAFNRLLLPAPSTNNEPTAREHPYCPCLSSVCLCVCVCLCVFCIYVFRVRVNVMLSSNSGGPLTHEIHVVLPSGSGKALTLTSGLLHSVCLAHLTAS